MPALHNRDSENMPSNIVAAAEEQKPSTENMPNGNKSTVELTTDFIAAWGAGHFNTGDVSAELAKFFTEDFVLDASSAAHSGVAAYKVHNGYSGLEEWFKFVGGFDFEEIEMSHVAGEPGVVPHEVWLRCSAKKAVCKATGKSAPFDCLNVLTWEGDKATKMIVVVYNPASVAAIMCEDDLPIPSPVQLPAFEPHSSPMEAFGAVMALWGAGELSKPEMQSKYIAAQSVDDSSDSLLAVGALSDVYKAHIGVEGIGLWIDYQENNLELSNINAVPVMGLKPGCVMVHMTCDVKHKISGKAVQGWEAYNELAYNEEGQFVYARHYWVNAPLLASIF